MARLRDDLPDLDPDFDNFLGAMRGYDTEDSRPTQQNVKAFMEDLFASLPGLDSDEELAAESWKEVMKNLEQSRRFWLRYFCGVEM